MERLRYRLWPSFNGLPKLRYTDPLRIFRFVFDSIRVVRQLICYQDLFEFLFNDSEANTKPF